VNAKAFCEAKTF